MRSWVIALLLLVGLYQHAHARTVTGYNGGRKTKIKLVEVAGVELEEKTARAFREMAKAARKRGLKTIDGFGMLLYQAQAAFQEWYGVLPAVTKKLRDHVLEGHV